MKSLSGKIADKIAAKKQAEHQAKLAAHKKKVGKKLKSTLKGDKLTKLQKTSAKKKAVLDKKANPKALAASKKKVAAMAAKLQLKHAGFGRYHKGKGTPITHWVMRNPKNGLYILADKTLRAKLKGTKKPAGTSSKLKVVKPSKPTVDKKIDKKTAADKAAAKKPAIGKKVEKVGKKLDQAGIVKKALKSNIKKATGGKKKVDPLVKLHLQKWDAKRKAALKKAGKDEATPLTAKEKAQRAASVNKVKAALRKAKAK